MMALHSVAVKWVQSPRCICCCRWSSWSRFSTREWMTGWLEWTILLPGRQQQSNSSGSEIAPWATVHDKLISNRLHSPFNSMVLLIHQFSICVHNRVSPNGSQINDSRPRPGPSTFIHRSNSSCPATSEPVWTIDRSSRWIQSDNGTARGWSRGAIRHEAPWTADHCQRNSLSTWTSPRQTAIRSLWAGFGTAMWTHRPTWKQMCPQRTVSSCGSIFALWPTNDVQMQSRLQRNTRQRM